MNRMKVDAACCDGKLSAGCESQFKTDNATELQRWRGHWTLASQGQLAASGQWRQWRQLQTLDSEELLLVVMTEEES